MIRPKFNKLQAGNKIRLSGEWEDPPAGTICTVVGSRRNSAGQMIEIEADAHDGGDPLFIAAGDIDSIEAVE